MAKDDGGFAFPTTEYGQTGPCGHPLYIRKDYGMTLRDYFAGQALAGLLASQSFADSMSRQKMPPEAHVTVPAGVAYEFADAMIAEGKK